MTRGNFYHVRATDETRLSPLEAQDFVCRLSNKLNISIPALRIQKSLKFGRAAYYSIETTCIYISEKECTQAALIHEITHHWDYILNSSCAEMVGKRKRWHGPRFQKLHEQVKARWDLTELAIHI